MNYNLKINEENLGSIIDLIVYLNHFEESKEFISLKCSKIFKHLIKLNQNEFEKSSLLKIMKDLFDLNEFRLEPIQKLFNFVIKSPNQSNEFENNKIIEIYYFYYDFYICHILETVNNGIIYNFDFKYHDQLDISLELIEKFVNNKIKNSHHSIIYELGDKILHLEYQIKSLIDIHFNHLNSNVISFLSHYLSIKVLNLEKIIPFLLDPFIEEIFIDTLDSYVYLNHQKYGRCQTYFKINEETIESLKTHLRMQSKLRLDREKNSIITVLKNKLFYCRVAIDIAPSHWKNVSIDIRKMNKNVLTIPDLISFNSLNLEMAAFFLFCLIYRINITISGEVDSGKTTLMNAIDLFCPNNYRRIYVEETIESIEIPPEYGHQLKYQVSDNSKENEINKLLHRTGDLIILGEILNKDESKAFFHCLSAGLKGFQTTHATSIESLIRRWTIHFAIPLDCLNDLGIIVLMKKIGEQRKILSINEIHYDEQTKKINNHELWKYNPINQTWIKSDNLSNSFFLKVINSYENLSFLEFELKSNRIQELIKNQTSSEVRDFYSSSELLNQIKKK